MNYLQPTILPSYAAGIDAGAGTVMVNSGSINGVPATSSHYLLTDVLRDQMHFQGVVISDYQDVTALPMVRRRAVYGLSSAETRAALWREQLRRFRRDHPDLTTAQTGLLDTVTAAIPGLLAGGKDSPDLEAAKEAAVQVLSETLHRNSRHFWETGAFRVIVTDQRGLRLFVVELSAIEGGSR